VGTEAPAFPSRDVELRLGFEGVIPGGLYGRNSTADIYLLPNSPQSPAGTVRGRMPYLAYLTPPLAASLRGDRKPRNG